MTATDFAPSEAQTEWPIVVTAAGPVMADVAHRRQALGETAVLNQHYAPAWRSAGIRAVTVELDSVQHYALLLAEIHEANGGLELIARGARLDSSEAIGVILAPSALALEGSESVGLWAHLGASICCLSYNLRNVYFDGVGESRDGGMSHAGKAIIRELQRASIIPDVSHLSDNSLADLLEVHDGTLIASHSNARALCSNPRNLTDDQAQEIAARKGLVAVSVHPTLLAEQAASLASYLDHVCHFVELLGIDHVALGADFIALSLDIAVPTLRRSDPAGAMYRAGEVVAAGLAGFESLAAVPAFLAERGFSVRDVRKLTSENYVRLLSDRDV